MKNSKHMKRYRSAFLVAVACSTAAAADGITLYGIVDGGIGYSRQDGADSDVTVDSGSSEDSHFGVRGREDLGGGLSGKFELESGIDLDQGAWSDEDRFLNHAAWVGLAGGFGDLRLGRQSTCGAHQGVRREQDDPHPVAGGCLSSLRSEVVVEDQADVIAVHRRQPHLGFVALVDCP
jgi:predicted porin